MIDENWRDEFTRICVNKGGRAFRESKFSRHGVRACFLFFCGAIFQLKRAFAKRVSRGSRSMFVVEGVLSTWLNDPDYARETARSRCSSLVKP
ncbi:MAG TPA: hypothetical protein VFZ34_14210 [Blastocatellia bacterium]|nr:hypothetical protein [Blastocatellia bacterium]